MKPTEAQMTGLQNLTQEIGGKIAEIFGQHVPFLFVVHHSENDSLMVTNIVSTNHIHDLLAETMRANFTGESGGSFQMAGKKFN